MANKIQKKSGICAVPMEKSGKEYSVSRGLKSLLAEFYDIHRDLQPSSFVDGIDYDSLTKVHWNLMRSQIDFSLTAKEPPTTPIICIQVDGLTNIRSTYGGSTYSLSKDGLTRKRQANFQRQMDLLNYVGIPLLILPGYFFLRDEVALATELVAWIDTECRRVNPENPEWDRMINFLSDKAVDDVGLPDWSKLVDASQLSFDV